MVLFIFIAPVCAHAGVFAAILGIPRDTGNERAVASLESPQSVPLLKATISVDPNSPHGGGDIIVDTDGILISDLGPDGVHQGAGTTDGAGEITTYMVKESDSLSGIAATFGVSVNTILWANAIKNPNTIRPGDTLVILPVSGVRHVVKKGDTLKAIALKYHGDVDDIVAYNQLVKGADLVEGTTIVIPGGEVQPPPAPIVKKKKPIGTSKYLGGSGGVSTSGYFIRPMSSAYPKTQGIHGYNGIDIGAPVGSEVRAAAAGSVILVRGGDGWNGGYGNYLVIKHNKGTQTLYAHLDSISVLDGETVSQGEAIGYSGNTGHSTGPHLHFEVRGGRNPF